MYAYCNNNPVMYVDPTGEIGLTIALGSIALLLTGGLTVYFLADTLVHNPPDLPSISLPRERPGLSLIPKLDIENSESPAISIPKTDENTDTRTPIIFPSDPNNFTPLGLVKVKRSGTRNGAIISWMDPRTNTEVFRWDENINFPNGPHYHIYGAGHFIPGVDKVLEPFASIYFPLR